MIACHIKGSRSDYMLNVDVITSILKEHNSFDYEVTTKESSEQISSNHQFTLYHKYVFIYRHEESFQVIFKEGENLIVPAITHKQFDFIGAFEIRYIDKKILLRLYEVEDLTLHRKYGTINKQTIANKSIHHMYVVVRSLKNEDNQNMGYALKEGSLLKIGQKEYFISSMFIGQSNKMGNQETIREKIMLVDSIINSKKIIQVHSGHTQGECKYCMMEETQEFGQFLCSPCKCSGSCGLVHFNCLEKWNQSKVKKNKVEGLTYYNFDKFFCEVCKDQYPKFVQKEGVSYELMPIELPKEQHIILEQIGIKNNSLICIENIPEDGIRIGRGNQCEIKVESPSISRNHARIQKIGESYIVFDNKSKFGTGVRDEKIYLEINKLKKGIQINRTVIMFQLIKSLLSV